MDRRNSGRLVCLPMEKAHEWTDEEILPFAQGYRRQRSDVWKLGNQDTVLGKKKKKESRKEKGEEGGMEQTDAWNGGNHKI